MLLSLLLPMTPAPAPAIGLPRLRRLPSFVGPHEPPDHQGDRNRRPLVPPDEAHDRHRDGLDLGEPFLDAHTHLPKFVNDVGQRGCLPASDALRPGSDIATENAGLGVGAGRNSPKVVFRSKRILGSYVEGKMERNAVPPVETALGRETPSQRLRGHRPERVDSAVLLPCSSSYAAVMGKQPELVVHSNRRV